jgi:hypothetical protein
MVYRYLNDLKDMPYNPSELLQNFAKPQTLHKYKCLTRQANNDYL